MALVPSAVFNLIEGDANYRKIVAEIQSVPPLVGVSYNVYFRVDGPIAPLKLPNFATPDGTLTPLVSLQVMPLVNLPLDSNGNTLEGTYILKYFIEDVTIPGVYSEVTSTINLNVLKEGSIASCKIVPKLNIDVNCFCYQLTATDNTVYSLAGYDVTLNSRILTVVIPTIPGQPTPTPVVTTDATITLGFDYSNVTYIVNLEAEYEHTNGDGTIVVIENLLASYSEKIACDFNLCALVECLAKTMAALESKASRVGGWPNLPVYERDTIYQVQQLITLLELYRNCGNYTKVYDIYKKLIALIGCDCGCSEGNGDQPIAVSPSCGGSGAVTDIVGIYPIVVNQAGLTATISLDPSFLAILSNVYTASNCITLVPGATSDFRLGGILSQDTSITASGVYDFELQGMKSIILNALNDINLQSTSGNILLDALTSITLQSGSGLLDFNNLELVASVLLEIEGVLGLRIRTPNTISSTAQPGDVLTLVNPVNGACDYSPVTNVLYFNDNPTNANYNDDGAGGTPVLTYNMPLNTLKSTGDYIDIDCLLTVQGTTGDNPVFNVSGFPLFSHTTNEPYKQTLKGRIVRTGATSFYCAFTSEIYELTTGAFIEALHQNSTGTIDWSIAQPLTLIFDLGMGDHVSTWKHFIVTKFKI